ncbi:nuclear pore complex protein Nup85-like isoform X1 [Biomphalaria glabrata]|uniref:Nuclear pore complex protein Nup85 n=2 Tax=Biomphalaria glabrata TaxID=6526 RepID=A0A9W2ZSB9_BIOGL|nr:nuclear pore complex protein Nup85-like isoform X1 [Biomphalaria glabrata]KAI8731424.1 nuclear pore complex protein Nup85 [Biomphalaria glabrata]
MAASTVDGEVEVFTLPFKKSRNLKLRSVWGMGKELYMFQSQIPHKEREESQRSSSESKIFDVQWNAEMHDIARKLVNETHNIFVILQGQVKSLSQSILYSQLRKASKQYRAVLKACSMELMQIADSCTDESKKLKYEEHIQEFEMVQLIWSLCEILFIDVAPGGLVLTSLLDWLQWHFQEGKQLATKVIHSDQPCEHPQYWEAIYRLLLQGDTENVRKLLALNVYSHSDSFIAADEVLKKMPRWTYQHAQSVAEYEMKWRHWREECVRRYEAAQFAAYPELETIVQVLCGDEAVFKDLKDCCETWYHLLVSKLLYQNPTCRIQDLTYEIKPCQAVYSNSSPQIQELDNILQAALEFDLHQVIKDSCTFLSNRSWWFVSHLADILHHCGQLDPQELPFGSNLREYLLLEYATSLMAHKSLYQVGIDYLDFCPVFGRSYIEAYVERIPLETERKAHKILHICLERDLLVQAQSICKVMGMKCLKQERFGSALSWFLKSKDATVIKQVTDRFLNEYCEEGKFSHLDLIDHLGPSMLITNSLTFLAKYREFHTFYNNGDVKGAVNLLLSLISSRLAPKFFWMTMLMDALPLLNLPEVVFNVSQTYELLHCLEELQRDGTSNYKNLKETEIEKLKLLRIALTRNLANAILQERSVRTVSIS